MSKFDEMMGKLEMGWDEGLLGVVASLRHNFRARYPKSPLSAMAGADPERNLIKLYVLASFQQANGGFPN